MGAITRSRPLSWSTPTWMPIPPNLPSICRRNCRHSPVLMYGGVRVEVLQHPFQGTLEQLAARYRTDIIGLDLLDGVDEQAVELEHLIAGLGIERGLPAKQANGTDHCKREISPVAPSAITLLFLVGSTWSAV